MPKLVASNLVSELGHMINDKFMVSLWCTEALFACAYHFSPKCSHGLPSLSTFFWEQSKQIFKTLNKWCFAV